MSWQCEWFIDITAARLFTCSRQYCLSCVASFWLNGYTMFYLLDKKGVFNITTSPMNDETGCLSLSIHWQLVAIVLHKPRPHEMILKGVHGGKQLAGHSTINFESQKLSADTALTDKHSDCMPSLYEVEINACLIARYCVSTITYPFCTSCPSYASSVNWAGLVVHGMMVHVQSNSFRSAV